MISCDKWNVKIDGDYPEVVAEASVLMQELYIKVSKEHGEKLADIALETIMRRAKLSDDEAILDSIKRSTETIGKILEKLAGANPCDKSFEDGKKYVFDIELCRKCLEEKGIEDFWLSTVWMNRINGKVVDVKSRERGYIYGYIVEPEWCREVE